MDKRLVIDTKIKIIEDSVEDIIEKRQYVGEIKETSTVIETIIAPSLTYEFENPSGKGIKTLKIISDVPITMSYTSQMNTYNFGAYFKEISLITNGEDENSTVDWIAKQGTITLTNTSAEDTAHIKIIFTY